MSKVDSKIAVCNTCKKPVASGPSSLTQWIFGRDHYCICYESTRKFLRAEAVLPGPVTECSVCDREIRQTDGTMTQWIFRSRYCACAAPSPKAVVIEKIETVQSYRFESALSDFAHIGVETTEVLHEELSRYVPLRKLGYGGAGAVFLCDDTVLNKLVAVKFLRHTTAKAVISFQMEARIAAKLVHPGIVRIIDFGATESSIPYMVMEAVCGISLKDYIAAHGAVSEPQVLKMATKLCSSLGYAHSTGTLHRDIKPGNIIVPLNPENDLVPILIDFGIAKFYEETLASGSQSETLAGSPEYMSPDTVLRKKYSQASEVYSLGCVLFEALTGRVPFQGESALETLAMHTSAKPPLLSEVRSDLTFSSQMQSIVSRCLEKEASLRFQSMADLERALSEINESSAPPQMINSGIAAKAGPLITKRQAVSYLIFATLIGAFSLAVYTNIKSTSETNIVVSTTKKSTKTQPPDKEPDLQNELLRANQAIDQLVKLATAGNTAAQIRLAQMYFIGRGIPQDYNKAYKWFKLAADKGDSTGQNYVGIMLSKGLGAERDPEQGLKWLLRSAKQGNFEAENNIGTLYWEGAVVKQDNAKALEWFRRAANHGYSTAQCNLGYMYNQGTAVKQDYKESLKWYRMAAASVYPMEGQFRVGWAYQHGLGVRQNNELAVAWYKKAAERGYAKAQYRLGYAYAHGLGVRQDDEESVKWLQHAADQGFAVAQCDLGDMYHYGRGVKQDDKEALRLYRLAADKNVAIAQNNMGFMYRAGLAVEKDYDKAMQWFKKAVENGNNTAAKNIAMMYRDGVGVKKDAVEANKWFERGKKPAGEKPLGPQTSSFQVTEPW